MGMLAGLMGGGSAAADAGTAAGVTPAIAGEAAPAVAGAAAPAASSWMGALQKAGQQRMENTVSGSGNSASTPSTEGHGLDGLYNVQTSSPMTSHSVAPVMSPDELLKNRNLSIGGNHGG
jgi:hypothetical protein